MTNQTHKKKKGKLVFSQHAVISVQVNGGEIPLSDANDSPAHIYNPLWRKKQE